MKRNPKVAARQSVERYFKRESVNPSNNTDPHGKWDHVSNSHDRTQYFSEIYTVDRDFKSY